MATISNFQMNNSQPIVPAQIYPLYISFGALVTWIQPFIDNFIAPTRNVLVPIMAFQIVVSVLSYAMVTQNTSDRQQITEMVETYPITQWILTLIQPLPYQGRIILNEATLLVKFTTRDEAAIRLMLTSGVFGNALQQVSDYLSKTGYAKVFINLATALIFRPCTFSALQTPVIDAATGIVPTIDENTTTLCVTFEMNAAGTGFQEVGKIDKGFEPESLEIRTESNNGLNPTLSNQTTFGFGLIVSGIDVNNVHQLLKCQRRGTLNAQQRSTFARGTVEKLHAIQGSPIPEVKQQPLQARYPLVEASGVGQYALPQKQVQSPRGQGGKSSTPQQQIRQQGQAPNPSTGPSAQGQYTGGTQGQQQPLPNPASLPAFYNQPPVYQGPPSTEGASNSGRGISRAARRNSGRNTQTQATGNVLSPLPYFNFLPIGKSISASNMHIQRRTSKF